MKKKYYNKYNTWREEKLAVVQIIGCNQCNNIIIKKVNMLIEYKKVIITKIYMSDIYKKYE